MLRMIPVLRNLIGMMALLMAINAFAQDLPGSEVSDSVVSQSAITLVNLAQDVYPELFSGATNWRTFDGFFYKYFSVSGVYVGINGPDLYLLGGPFGGAVQYKGTVADALIVLQGSGGSTQLFNNVTTANSLLELLSYFRSLTLSYGTVTSTINLQAQISLEAKGQELFGGVNTDIVMMTLSGTNLSTPNTYKMWVNAQGTIVKLRQNDSFDFVMPTSNAVGAGLVSGMLIAIKAADAPAVREALNNTLQNNAAVSQKTQTRVISGVNLQTLVLEIGDSGSASVLLEVSDFGAFSMATKMQSKLTTTTTSFEITSAVLR